MTRSATIAVVVIVLAVLAGAIIWFANQTPPAPISPAGQSYGSSGSSANSSSNGSVSSTVSVSTSTSAPTSSGSTTTTGGTATPPARAMVTYTEAGFSPATVTIRKGGTVTFNNGSQADMRVASNPHPIHNGYPTTGGCVGSTFDSCANIPPGGSWSFTFTFVGSWGYHNHLNPGQVGTVVVK